jgi:hypothetical protein
MRKSTCLVPISLLFFSAAIPLLATTEVPTVETEADSDFALGTLLDTYSANFSNTSESGTVYEDVYRNPDGDIDFFYQLENNPGSPQNPSPDTISRITLGNFTGFTGDSVDYVEDSGTVGANTDTDVPPYDATIQNNNSSVGFNFGDEYDDIAPGETSDWVEVSTNAKSYNAKGTFSIIDSYTTTITGNPGPATPEPSTVTLLFGGLLALIGVVRARLRSV